MINDRLLKPLDVKAYRFSGLSNRFERKMCVNIGLVEKLSFKLRAIGFLLFLQIPNGEPSNISHLHSYIKFDL